MTIYLAGSKRGSEEGNAISGWRQKAARLLPYESDIRDPFRGKKHLPDGKFDDISYTANEIVTRDLKDIRESDVVLAEMVFDDYNYIGTCMEIRAAAEYGVPVVIWCPKAVAKHYWIEYHTVKSFETLEECCDYINAYWM